VTSPQAFEGLREAGRKVWRISSIVATADHNTPTTGWERGYDGITDPISKEQITTLDSNIAEFVAAAFYPFLSIAAVHRARDRPRVGRHAAGHDGGLRRLAHLHARSPSARWRTASAPASRARDGLATLLAKKAKNLLVKSKRQAAAGGCTAKDIVLAIIGRIGTAGGTATRSSSPLRHPRPEHGRPHDGVQHGDRSRCARGPRRGVDEKTIAYVKGRPLAPTGVEWDQAVAYWKTLQSDPARTSTPWSNSTRADPAAGHLGHLARDGAPIDGRVPDPDKEKDANKRGAIERALSYMGWSRTSR
jgi:3-isopropylmalate/(R)-2-methylmalate dehydratase large subunit